MRILYLDLASNHGSLACVDDASVVHLTSVDHRIDDSVLTGLVEQTLKDAGWAYEDLSGIACVVGPGGFTSLRVGVAAANALGSALGIPVCGVHLSDLYRARSPLPALRATLSRPREREQGKSIFWLHSTKRTELFIRSNEFPGPQCITLEELPKHLKKGQEWMGELIPEHQKIVTDVGLTLVPLLALEEVLPEFLGSQKYQKQILQPWYGRGW